MPAPRRAGRIAVRQQPPTLAPVGAVLAGALLAGGAVYALPGAHSTRIAVQPDGSMTLASKVQRPTKTEVLPLIAFASLEPDLASAAPIAQPTRSPARAIARSSKQTLSSSSTAVSRAIPPQPALEKPIAPPRRDLAGFLAEQGHVLAPTETGPNPAMPEEAALTPAPPPATRTPGGEPALAGTEPGVVLAAVAPTAIRNSIEPADAAPADPVVQTFPTVSVHGIALGAVTMRGDTVHLASLLGLLKLKLPAEEFARLQAAPAADSFVSLAKLRAAGLDVTIDRANERIALAAL